MDENWEGFDFAKTKAKLYKYGKQKEKKKRPIYLG